MSENKEIKGGIAWAVDILKAERNRIQHVIDLLEGNAEVREIDVGQSVGTSRRAKEQKPRKKPPATKKRTYIAFYKHIEAVLEEADKPLSPFSMSRRILDKFNISVTEAALKKTLKADGGRTFCEPQDGLWGLVK